MKSFLCTIFLSLHRKAKPLPTQFVEKNEAHVLHPQAYICISILTTFMITEQTGANASELEVMHTFPELFLPTADSHNSIMFRFQHSVGWRHMALSLIKL